MKIQPVKQIKNLSGKRVLLRVDFNVPIKNGRVLDDFKIQKTLPTIKYLIEKRAKVILISHLGRPKGVDKKLSLKPVAEHLEKALKQSVKFFKAERLEDYKRIKATIEQLSNGTVALLENVRFVPGEEDNDPKVAKALASLADLFVLDGFAVAHRDSASVSGVAKLLPSYAGLLLFEELSVLYKARKNPKPPLVVILGGAKVETKIPVMREFLSKADFILVGGEIANTYWWAKGKKVGGSLVGKKFKRAVLTYCANKKVILPVDVVVGKQDGTQARVMPVNSKFQIRDSKLAVYDVGPATVRLFAEYIKMASTLIWNGAMGKFETHPYGYGTYAVADLFAARSRGHAFGITGGGETVQILQKRGILESVDLVSTGGGAMLEFLGGKELPGVKALQGKTHNRT